MKRIHRLVITLCLLVGLAAQPAAAVLTIEITQGVDGAVPLAVVPFGWEGFSIKPTQSVSEVVQSDLYRSGQFQLTPREDMLELPRTADQVNFKNWRLVGAEFLVVGKISEAGGGQFTVRFELLDVFKGTQLVGKEFTVSDAQIRGLSHHIADTIFEAITGLPGAFSTRIAYVTTVREAGVEQKYQLMIADSDGYNPRTILRSKEPVMSPAWSADGEQLAYVSFEQGRSEVYIQNLATGKRKRISSAKGINGAPAWSPDGSRLALTLSQRGNPDIYVIDLMTGSKKRLTQGNAIDTEANWAPDGQSIIFTSDRGGKPQLYKMAVDGGQAKRVTFEGDYNARGVFSPNGKQIAMVHGLKGAYHIAILELASGLTRVLTKGRLDESPTFAPNGSMILYATQEGNRGVLAAVSEDGRVRQRLILQEGDVREPAWSPYRR